MHSTLAPLSIALLALCCASAQALTVSAACMQPADDDRTEVYVELHCRGEADCGPPPEQVSIEFIGMDVGAFPVAQIAWIDARGRASLDPPDSGPRHAVWSLPQGFVVEATRARLSVDNEALTPDFELRRKDCSRLNAAALALLKASR